MIMIQDLIKDTKEWLSFVKEDSKMGKYLTQVLMILEGVEKIGRIDMVVKGITDKVTQIDVLTKGEKTNSVVLKKITITIGDNNGTWIQEQDGTWTVELNEDFFPWEQK